MDYRFNKFNSGVIYCSNRNSSKQKTGAIYYPIIKIGRDTFPGNHISVPEDTTISRRHCLIINSIDDVWLYDLASTTGTYVNNERVVGKVPLIGRNIIRIGGTEYEMTNDKKKLL